MASFVGTFTKITASTALYSATFIGEDEAYVGKPRYIRLQLSNGKTFTIESNGVNDGNTSFSRNITGLDSLTTYTWVATLGYVGDSDWNIAWSRYVDRGSFTTVGGVDWTASMEQTYEFYEVDPDTWNDRRKLDTVISCTINRETSNSTLGSATMDCVDVLDECYVRVYLIAIQNGITEKVPLGTYLVQTPSVNFDGKASSISMDAYTPLIELKGTLPPIGYSLLEGQPIMEIASRLCREKMRAPVVLTSTDDTLNADFVSNLDDNWLTFISDLISNAKYSFGLDEMGRVIFEPVQDVASLRPVWTYDDGNSSILYPDISNDRDLYGIPNVVEVVYSTTVGYRFSRVVNDDKNSPVSTVTRGREVVYRDSNPSFAGVPTQAQIDDYARQLLRNLSCLEHTITYKHGYCPARIGDCVMLNYEKAGLVNVKAKVISQSITCETGCPVEETAIYTTKLWR